MQKSHCYLILGLLLLFNSQFSLSQNAISRTELNDSIKKMPGFTLHKDTYFITGIPTNQSIDKNTADIKYQVSFKQLITRNTLPWESYLFVSYSQKAFWDIYKESSPFKEINFNPSVGFGKAVYNKKDELVGLASLALEHESNGRDSIYSRSWNNIHATYNTKVGKNTRLGIKAWIPFMYKKGNPDLLEYIGLGEVTVAHNFIPKKLLFEVMVRKGLKWNWQGAIRSRLYYNPFQKKSNQYFMLEWYNGYAESLINYTEYTSMIRIGYVIKSNEFGLL